MSTRPRLLTMPDAQTEAQLTYSVPPDRVARKTVPATYATYRRMRRDPTIALARALTIAPALAGGWTVEADPSTPAERKTYIERGVLWMRNALVRGALEGGCDYGWAPHEIIWQRDTDGVVWPAKVKPLLVDITDVLIDPETGNFAGYRQRRQDGGHIYLAPEYTLHFAWRVEGSNWYGESLLENVREVWQNYRDTDDGAARYDKKVAGTHWVIYYPEGQSRDGIGGPLTDNAVLARRFLAALEASGSLAVPQQVYTGPSGLPEIQPAAGWRVELLSDTSPRQGAFVERERYLDALKVRALLMPERAILEGQFGTKAEAGAHADLALTQRQVEHQHVVDAVNEQLVDRMLAETYGQNAVGSVWIRPSPLADEKIAWLRQVYAAVLANPAGAMEEMQRMDIASLRKAVGLPDAENLADPANMTLIKTEGTDTGNPLGATVASLYDTAADVIEG